MVAEYISHCRSEPSITLLKRECLGVYHNESLDNELRVQPTFRRSALRLWASIVPRATRAMRSLCIAACMCTCALCRQTHVRPLSKTAKEHRKQRINKLYTQDVVVLYVSGLQNHIAGEVPWRGPCSSEWAIAQTCTSFETSQIATLDSRIRRQPVTVVSWQSSARLCGDRPFSVL